jgi:hypothetical protein
MINLSTYEKPQPLRRIIDDVLEPEKLQRFRLLDDAYRAAKRGEIPWEHLDCAEEEWQGLHHEIDDSAKEIFATGELLIRGWVEGATDQEPTTLLPSTLTESQLWVAENEVRANGKRYVSCSVIQRASSPLDESATTLQPGSPGRPVDPKMKAAYQEAFVRVEAGEKKDAVALEIAKKYDVPETTLRTCLKPSRTPVWAKS